MKIKRLLLVIPALIVTIIAAAWITWYLTRPVVSNKYSLGLVDLVFYSFDTRLDNAATLLRDGLMRGLARSGQLPPGYPKLEKVPRGVNPAAPGGCAYTRITNLDRYFIQLTEDQYNHIELPACPFGVMDESLDIYILPPFPWAKTDPLRAGMFPVEEDVPIPISIHIGGYDYYIDRGSQYSLLIDILTKIGVRALPDDGR